MRGGKRSSAGVDEIGERLLAHIEKNPSQRADQIAKAMRSEVMTIRLPMKKLVAAKKVKTKGQRRGMTYAAV
jgi:predicted ArsR family transcriptional regulator